MKTAYPYLRFSDPKQASGDSEAGKKPGTRKRPSANT